jgi:hypothetical protein
MPVLTFNEPIAFRLFASKAVDVAASSTLLPTDLLLFADLTDPHAWFNQHSEFVFVGAVIAHKISYTINNFILRVIHRKPFVTNFAHVEVAGRV